MLRAIRFACQLDFEIHDDLVKTMTKQKNRINIVTNERIVDEINKIILSKTPSMGFKILEKTGILEIIIPELTSLKGIDEIEGQKHKDNFYHTLEVLDNISKKTDNLWLRWAPISRIHQQSLGALCTDHAGFKLHHCRDASSSTNQF